jgi:hypothetical protein
MTWPFPKVRKRVESQILGQFFRAGKISIDEVVASPYAARVPRGVLERMRELFTTTSMRDMLLHASEHQYTVSEIGDPELCR